MALILTRRVGERILIGNDIVIEVCSLGCTKARLGVQAPDNVVVVREEMVRKPVHRVAPGMARVMRADRTICEVDSQFMAGFCEWLQYAQASDGTWVPRCDLEQYERGEREARVDTATEEAIAARGGVA